MTKSSRITRVNARLPEDDAKKLAYLAKAERKSVSEIIRAAIQRYYSEAKSAEAAAAGILRRIGFIGCVEGDGDLSVTYKKHVDAYLRRKHGYR
jgi:metal-responsive CopG/Arc/MetJ family transcriptional regulator